MRYVWRGGNWIDRETGEPMQSTGRICMPMVIPDTPEYRSPIDGRLISGRSARREDLKRNNCVPYEPNEKAPKGLRNVRFAKKHGMIDKLAPDVREQYESRKS